MPTQGGGQHPLADGQVAGRACQPGPSSLARRLPVPAEQTCQPLLQLPHQHHSKEGSPCVKTTNPAGERARGARQRASPIPGSSLGRFQGHWTGSELLWGPGARQGGPPRTLSGSPSRCSRHWDRRPAGSPPPCGRHCPGKPGERGPCGKAPARSPPRAPRCEPSGRRLRTRRPSRDGPRLGWSRLLPQERPARSAHGSTASADTSLTELLSRIETPSS